MNNFKSTKRALVTSIISMFLCFAMLLGTTFAWFTDSVSSDGNVIKSGTLDVEMFWAKGTEEPTAANWKDASKGAIFDYNRWEPGYTVARHIKIENRGTLSFDYKLAIIPHGEVSKLADVIDVYIIPQATATTRDSFEAIAEEYKQGTLRQLINTGIAAGELGAAGVKSFTIILKMQDEADNEYMNLSIGSDFSVQLLASQVKAESDSFGNDYDKNAFVVVDDVDDFKAAVANAIDTTTIFVKPGNYVFAGDTFVIQGKSINIVGLGVVNFVKANGANRHMFTVQEEVDPKADTVVTFKNINFDGNKANNTRGNIFMVKYNVTLNLENVITKNAAGADICIDNANPLKDGQFYNGVTTTVNLKNADVERVSMDTIPVVPTHVYYPDVPAGTKTYAHLNYENSFVNIVEKQPISSDPTTMYVNGDNSSPIGYVFNVRNDKELKSALDAIQAESRYWNTPVTVKMAAGEYAGNYVINQYPEWNGIVGHTGSGNNYVGGVPANAPVLKLTIEGAARTTFAARNVAVVPEAIFTGTVTVNGFGNSVTDFKTTDANPAPITFKTVAFKGDYTGAGFVGTSIVFKATAAADNLTFDGCYFVDSTHITVGANGSNRIGDVSFNGCHFENGGCISGRFESLTATNCTVNGADFGFVNAQKGGSSVTVDGLTGTLGAYVVRTATDGAMTVNVTDVVVDMYKADGTNNGIVVRAAGTTVTATDCEFEGAEAPLGGNYAGSANLDMKNYYEEAGATYYTESNANGETTDVVLDKVDSNVTGSFTVPENVTVLSNGAFTGSGVTTVTIPEGITDFGASGVSATGASGGAFKDSKVEKIVLPEGMTEIPAAAFNGAKNLKEVNIPASVNTIGVNAFRSTAITTLTIPATVTSIATGAFRDMDSLVTVTFEGDIAIPNFAFRNCDNLRTVYLNGENTTVNGGTAFANTDTNNPNTNNITFYVKNETVAKQVQTSMGAGTDFFICINGTDWVAHEINSFNHALANVANGGTVLVWKDITLTEAVTVDKDITIDLCGNKLTGNFASGNAFINVNSNATIKNGKVAAGEGIRVAILIGAADVELSELEVSSCTQNYFAIRANAGANVAISDSVVNATKSAGGILAAGGNVTLDNVTVNQTGWYSNNWNCVALGIHSGGKMTINSGSYTSDPNGEAKGTWVAYIMSSGGTLEINGGTFNGTPAATANAANACGLICSDAMGIVNINGGTFNSTGAILDMRNNTGGTNPKATISGGTFSADPRVSGLYGSNLISIASGYTVVDNGNGTFIVAKGDKGVNDTASLIDAINNAADGDEIVLAAGTYDLRFTNHTDFNVDNLTITGIGKVYLNITSTETAYSGRIQGDNVTFNNIDFTGAGMVYATGKATYNNCVFNRVDASSGKADTYINNCTILGDVHTEPGMNSGNVYVTDCKVSAAYNASQNLSTFTFTNCEIVEINTWGAGTTVLNNCTFDPALIINDSAAHTLIVDGKVTTYVFDDADLAKALTGLKDDVVNYIVLGEGTYAADINLTVAALGAAKGDVYFVAAEGAEVVLAGTTTIGYRQQNVGAANYDAAITFDGIIFDHADVAHSLSIQDTNSIYMVNCTVIGEAEHGIGSQSGNNVGYALIEKCKFINAGLQLYGHFSMNLVIDNCEFVESVVNVGSGGAEGPEIKNSKFTLTLTDAHDAQSFYVIRSSGTGANTTVTNCDITVDSKMTFVGTAGAKGWGVFVTIGSYNVTVDNVRVTMTEAALAQPALDVVSVKSGVAGKVNLNDVTLNGGSYKVYDTAASLYDTIAGLQAGDTLLIPGGTYITSGTFLVPAGVTLKGQGGKEVVIHQNSSAQDDILNCAGDVTLINITFESNRKGYAVAGNTKNHDTDGDITIISCNFKGIATEKNYGVYKNLNGNLVIVNSTFDNYNNAICGVNNANGSTTVVEGCTFTNINGEAVGLVVANAPAGFKAELIAKNVGLTDENIIEY